MSGLDTLERSDTLASLVEKSMILFDVETGRYHATETVRPFAADQLSRSAMSHSSDSWNMTRPPG